MTCTNSWCTDHINGHTFHEGVTATILGHDPRSDRPRWLQLALFAPQPPGNLLHINPQLGLTLSGPDLLRNSGADRISVTMESRQWAELATEIRVAQTKMNPHRSHQ